MLVLHNILTLNSPTTNIHTDEMVRMEKSNKNQQQQHTTRMKAENDESIENKNWKLYSKVSKMSGEKNEKSLLIKN